MQRLVHIRTGTSRLFRVIDANYFENNKLFYEKQNSFCNINNLIFNRCLTTKNKDSKNIDTHADLYKPSTAKKETHVPDNLQGGQSPETFDTDTGSSSTGGGKVWSAQNPDAIHVVSSGLSKSTASVPTSTEGSKTAHERTVYTTKSELNIADPFKTRTLQAEATPTQSAEAAAASAFESFAPKTPSKSSPTAEASFTPKVSSTKSYSTTSTPTAQFDSAESTSSQQDTVKYETAHQPKVFGGQDTSAETKKRPKENPFNLKEQIKPSSDSNEIDIRNNILHESLKYVHEKGWSMEAIRAVVIYTGMSGCHQPVTTEKLFYNGYDLVEYFMRDANTKMMDYMNELANKENIQGSRLLVEGLKYRLKLVIPYADTWEQALAQKGLPPNAKRAWKSLLDLANDVWISIGDTATDIKWYTKRLSIAIIYRSAEIYMLQDQSPAKMETMNFLERHLGDFQTTGSVRPSISKSLSDTAQVASGLLTVVRTMTTRR